MTGESQQRNAFFRQLLFLAALIALGLVIFYQLNFFVGAFLGAITMYVILRGSLFGLVELRHWKSWMAASLLVGLMFILLLGIGYVVFMLIASEVPQIDTTQVMTVVKELPDEVNGWIGFQLINEKVIQQTVDFLGNVVSSLVNTTYSFAANVFMMLVILYFMLANARPMERTLFAYMPFTGQSMEMLKHETRGMIYSNAIGIPLIMISQGAVAGLIYWIVGIPNAMLWGFITGLCGLIPMVGTVIVSIPLGISLIVNSELWQGILVISCGILIVANIDNLCRIILMKHTTNTHPLVVIFGVILGIPFFGFWGIIFGPLLISGFLLLIKIYYREYRLIRTGENGKKKIE